MESHLGLNFESTLDFARKLDQQDPLRAFRDEFHFPKTASGKPYLYFTGNSLGLQPKRARDFVNQELDVWADLAVEGHFKSTRPWLTYHEQFAESMARIVGAKPVEVVVMNTLTVNPHLLMVSFYRPTRERFKILIEGGAFPSDQYAVASQARFHGFDPKEAVLELRPRDGETLLRKEDILETICKEGSSIALVLLGNVNYLTGQSLDMKEITQVAQKQGCKVGFDLAHGAGNLLLSLHDWNVDFAVWCTYKYLNSGPGSLGGCFVHERYARDRSLPRFEGWWGNDKANRFEMTPDFRPSVGADAWQLSNAPVLSFAAMRASLELFDRATMPALRKKSESLTSYLEFLLKHLPGVEVITPADPEERGCQLSLRFQNGAKALLDRLIESGAICDFRAPNIIRVAPTPLYNSYKDVFRFSELLSGLLKRS